MAYNQPAKSSPPQNYTPEMGEQDRAAQLRALGNVQWGKPRKRVLTRKATPEEMAHYEQVVDSRKSDRETDRAQALIDRRGAFASATHWKRGQS